MGRQIVPQHEVPWLQRRTHDCADPTVKTGAVDGPIDDPGSVQPVKAQGCEPGMMGSLVVRDTIDHPLAGRRPAIAARHRQGRVRLINALQALDVEGLDCLPEGSAQRLDALRVPLRRVERLFFTGSLSRWSSRQIVAALTCGPCAAAIRSRNASRVASGWVSTAWRRKAVWSLRARRLPPAWGFAAPLPLRRNRRHSFSTNERLTQKRSAWCVVELRHPAARQSFGLADLGSMVSYLT
jgi:hypothetical protein